MTDTAQNTTTQPITKLTPMEAVRSSLTKMEREFANALPPQIPPQKFIRTTVTAVQMNPDLLDADRRSLFAACMKAAQDGLLLDGREAALVVFRTKSGPMVQYMPMIGGLLKKMRNSGEIASFSAHVAHENDQFVYELGDEERIVHKPAMGDRGRAIAAYAIGKTKDGATYREVMSFDEIEQVRAVSRASGAGPWTQWWGEMARKTVSRRLLKRMPSSADLDAVLEHDNETNELGAPPAEVPAIAAPNRLRASIGVEAPPETIADTSTSQTAREPGDEAQP